MFCSRFFFQLRVKDKDGNILVPKKNTLAAYKSGIRMEVKKRHKVDILNGCLLTDHQKLWRSVEKVLVSEGCSENWHHDEVQPATMRNIYHLLSLQSRAEQTYNLLPTDAHKEKGERFLFPMWRALNQAKFNLHNPPMRNSSSPTRKVGRCSDLLKIILSFLQLGRIPSARCSRSCVRRQAAPSRQIIQLGMVLQFFVDCSVAFAVWSSTRALNIKTSEIIKFCPDFC